MEHKGEQNLIRLIWWQNISHQFFSCFKSHVLSSYFTDLKTVLNFQVAGDPGIVRTWIFLPLCFDRVATDKNIQEKNSNQFFMPSLQIRYWLCSQIGMKYLPCLLLCQLCLPKSHQFSLLPMPFLWHGEILWSILWNIHRNGHQPNVPGVYRKSKCVKVSKKLLWLNQKIHTGNIYMLAQQQFRSIHDIVTDYKQQSSNTEKWKARQHWWHFFLSGQSCHKNDWCWKLGQIK